MATTANDKKQVGTNMGGSLATTQSTQISVPQTPQRPAVKGLGSHGNTNSKRTGTTNKSEKVKGMGSFIQNATPKADGAGTGQASGPQKPGDYQAPQFNQTYQKPTFGSEYQQANYESKYQDQIDAGMNKILNREKFEYDPLKDTNYQALAGLYSQQGDKAAKDTMADAAALNGGYGSSFAQTAAQQVRNDYNQQLSAMIPELQNNAYQQYLQEYNMDKDAVNMLQSADDREYSKHRDSVADSQWQYGQEYAQHRDNVADSQWQYGQEYAQHRDSVADSQWKYGMDYQAYRDDVGDQQWQQSFDRGVYESDRDYNRGVFESDRAYDYQVGRDAVADQQWQQTYDRGVFESDRDYNRGVFESNRDYNRGVFESNRDYNYQAGQDRIANAQRWAEIKKDSGSSGSSTSGTPTYTAAGGNNSGGGASFDDQWRRAGGR